MTVALQAALGALIGAAGGVLSLLSLRAYLPLRQAPLVGRVSTVGAVLAGLLLGLALGGAGYGLRIIVTVVIVSGLLATLSLVDLATRRLPNLLVLLLLLWGLAQAPLGITNWRMMLTGTLFGALMFGLLGAIGRGALGVGDVKLAIAIGAVLGLPAAVQGLVLGVLAGGAGAILLLVTGTASRKDKMAYGPYLAAGAWVTYLGMLGMWG